MDVKIPEKEKEKAGVIANTTVTLKRADDEMRNAVSVLYLFLPRGNETHVKSCKPDIILELARRNKRVKKPLMI